MQVTNGLGEISNDAKASRCGQAEGQPVRCVRRQRGGLRWGIGHGGLSVDFRVSYRSCRTSNLSVKNQHDTSEKLKHVPLGFKNLFPELEAKSSLNRWTSEQTFGITIA